MACLLVSITWTALVSLALSGCLTRATWVCLLHVMFVRKRLPTMLVCTCAQVSDGNLFCNAAADLVVAELSVIWCTLEAAADSAGPTIG